jgi:hypothetical protein
MLYPVEILPQTIYKKIDCDLTEQYLIRHTETNCIEEIWDSESNCLNSKCISLQSKQIVDISTSLLSLFKGSYTKIELTDGGKGKYNDYCNPYDSVEVPIYEDDFVLNHNRCYWTILIEKINGKVVNYQKGTDVLNATCFVVHTPTKWNVWHFSIRWNTHLGFIHEDPASQKQGWVRRLAHSATVLIQESAMIGEPILKQIDEKCFKREAPNASSF